MALVAVAFAEIVSVLPSTAVIVVRAGIPVPTIWWPSWNEPDVVLVMVTVFEPLVMAPRPAPPPMVGWSSTGIGPTMFSSRFHVAPPSSERNRPEPTPP